MVDLRIGPADRLLILGASGSGKSTLGNAIARRWSRYVACDPNGDPADLLPGTHLARSADDAIRHLPGRVMWWPAEWEEGDMAERWGSIVKRALDLGRHGILMHELADVVPVNGGNSTDIMRRAYRRGRHSLNPIVGCSQRPKWIDRLATSQSNLRALFWLDEPADFRFGAELVGLDDRQRSLDLPEHHFYFRGHDRNARLCRPIPHGG